MSLAKHLHFDVWIFGCIVGSMVSLAHAQPAAGTKIELTDAARSQAEQAFWKGKEHYDAGEFEQARIRFQAAYRLVNDPNLLYNIAQASRKLGDCRQALESYEQFLKDTAESPLALQAEKQVVELEAACPRQASATTPGQPTLVVPSEPPPTAPAIAVGNGWGSGSESKHSQSPDVKSARESLPWVMTTFVTGLVAGGTAIGLAIWNDRRYDDWTERNRSLRLGTAPGETATQWQTRQQLNNELIISVQRVDKNVVALGIGAGALLATSAVLHFFWRNSESPSPSDRKRTGVLSLPLVSVGATSATFALQGSFP
jgi:tetratricopeptide (TPR) repeat protein